MTDEVNEQKKCYYLGNNKYEETDSNMRSILCKIYQLIFQNEHNRISLNNGYQKTMLLFTHGRLAFETIVSFPHVTVY